MGQEIIDYTIIIPVYFNEGSITRTFEEIHSKVITPNNRPCEVIFIDDGSGDNSLSEIFRLKDAYPSLIRVVKLTRNFGQVPAMMAGYSIARGKCIINISADFQDPPELINQMIDHYFNDNYQIVVGTRLSRKESWYRIISSKLFYWMIRKMSFRDMPPGGFDLALISNTVKNIILKNREANPFWQGQILWTGYEVKFVPYSRRKRAIGTSRWTFPKLLKYLIDSMMSYSYFPLRVMSGIGVLLALAGFIYAIVVLVSRLTGGLLNTGWAPLMIAILILSGIQMLMLGVVGEYLWRSLDQVRNRELYIIEKIYE
jgi:dolichol-phosphate mannosyltransferase